MNLPTNYDEFKEAIDISDEYAVGCLIFVYQGQTESEKASQATLEDNGIGFNGVDAGIMSSFAEFYKRAGFLTPPQMILAKKKIKKYHGQILPNNVQPLPFKSRTSTPAQSSMPDKPDLTATLREENDTIIVMFKYPKGDPGFRETLLKVKSLHGRKWVAAEKCWTVPLNLMAVKSLIHWGFKLDMKLELWHNSVIIDPETLVETDPGLLNGDLYPFQKKGVNFLQRCNGRGIVGDIMGLGKTVQSLGWANITDTGDILITCPANVKLKWAREVQKWLGHTNLFIINGRPNPDMHDEYEYKAFQVDQAGAKDNKREIIIINYDILGNLTAEDPNFKPTHYGQKPKRVPMPGTGWADYLKLNPINALIMDEYHYIKNNKAARTKAVLDLGDQCTFVIGLSGTPIINRPIEFFNGIQMINPQIFPGWHYYVTNFCDGHQTAYGWEVNGASNKKKFHQILSNTIMIRRKKEDVLPELPPKMRSVVPLAIDNRKEYQAAESDVIKWIERHEGQAKADRAQAAEALVTIEKLKQLAVKGKMTAAIEWIQDHLDSGEKLIVFADHKFVVDILMKKFKKVAVKIDGSIAPSKRLDIVDQFQNDPSVQLFVGTKAAKEGIDLTAAHNLAFIELFWTPGDHDQCEDRCYGRLDDLHGANIYYLVADDTVENPITTLLDEKRINITAMLDGEDVAEDHLLTKLLERMRYQHAA